MVLCSNEEIDHGTECLLLALRHSGVKAKLVSGTPHLWKVTEEKDLEVARTLLPRITRNTSLVCQALASSQPCHTAGDSYTRNPFSDSLTCNKECLRVFALLDDTLRRTCKELHFSPRYNTPVPSPTSLVAITSIITTDTLPQHLRSAAAEISKTARPVIIIINQQDHSSNVTSLSLVSLQQDVREAFSDHLGPVTVILRSPSRVPEMVKEGECAPEVHGHTSDLDHPPPDTDQLPSLLASLLDQTSRCFHGLVLVL
ncbi:D-ribitol-5-phosphate cytidylyltransferase [Chionoecetes opilio]|uniref:D-ribitol-5-phosphate cytidylyltransferase n=1 Tax=Chionoecetes opilio TaxID=41210 RepID=A0A8J4Y9Y4_CHIOP|nr:D-ribitol-5-phosphate cytidylyltransferase [Chionoecetes opilio]